MILVVGATGKLGSMIVRLLLKRGERVRMLVRPNANYQPLVEAGAQPVMGDMKDRASLDAAMDGVKVVVTTATASQRGGEDTIESVDRQGNLDLVDAAKAANVEQFVFVSALGSDPNSPNPIFSAKGAVEAHLRASGMPYTILVANIFMEVWIGAIVGMPLQMKQPVTLIGEAQRKHCFISDSDVAAFAANVIGHPAALNQTLHIGGPEAVCWRDVVQQVGEVMGGDVPTRFIQMGEMLPLLPPVFSELMAATNMFESVIPMEETARTYNVQMTTLRDYARRTFGGAQ